MSFYEQLVAETVDSRDAFLSIPIVRSALRHGAPRSLYLAFLGEAYHHVKHTFPLLALAASRTADGRYQDALLEYMKEEHGHEKWILDDIRTLGGDPDAVSDGEGGAACRIMVAYAYYSIEHVSPYAFLRRLIDGFHDRKTQRVIIDNAAIFYRLYGSIFHDLGARAELSHAA